MRTLVAALVVLNLVVIGIGAWIFISPERFFPGAYEDVPRHVTIRLEKLKQQNDRLTRILDRVRPRAAAMYNLCDSVAQTKLRTDNPTVIDSGMFAFIETLQKDCALAHVP